MTQEQISAVIALIFVVATMLIILIPMTKEYFKFDSLSHKLDLMKKMHLSGAAMCFDHSLEDVDIERNTKEFEMLQKSKEQLEEWMLEDADKPDLMCMYISEMKTIEEKMYECLGRGVAL